MHQDQVIEKVKKLLALSRSTNEHEAALAASRAADLMLKYQIDEAKLAVSGDETAPESIGAEVVGDGDRTTVVWKGTLGFALAEMFGCQVIWHRSHVYEKQLQTRGGGLKRTARINLQVIGPQSSARAVSYLFLYLTNEITRLAGEKYDPERDVEYQLATHFSGKSHAARRWKMSFCNGAVATIVQRLRNQRRETFAAARAEVGTGAALVVVDRALERINTDKARAQAWVTDNVGPLQAGRGSKAAGRLEAFAEGCVAAEKINLAGGRGLSAGNKQIK
jgi:hypothetical protein